MLTCKTCGVTIDVTVAACPACGAEVPMARLTGMLGLVCRACDAYNDPGARACAGCGKPLGADPESPAVAGAAPRAQKARLVVERGEAPAGASFELRPGEAQAGRAEGQLLFPEDPCLSPLHATFALRDGTLLVRDEGAAGGVFVRLRGLTVPLRPGHLFALGERLLRFGGPLAPPAPPGPDGTRRLGAARPEGPAVVIEEWLEGGAGGRSWIRAGPSITLGRSGCSVNLGDDPHLAPAHAELLLDAGGEARLRDLGSTTGTFLRVPTGAERELHDGDAVRMGREVLRVELA
ncbi:FHA domain-containing protein [Anaeromyxobacter diazotrophicus]|uniref:FHA domain-containing protein n=1 Tax=Anaeromyxobacter diazotrophicus TaxID=2590199 RepID=A0A7I9VNY8_9BACT|nr:FHA domain-containing protein [Anaeromyxobacter diazotrophicus]GEJ57918.1 hypothetical protein AMYX_26590 [Anaeromyxobacter diazotrophicus]